MHKRPTNLRIPFWCASLFFCIYFVVNVKTTSFLPILASFLILLVVLFSFYLWIERGGEGLPIFPMFIFLFIFTYALPLVSNSLTFQFYSPGSEFYAGFTILIFMVAGIIGWTIFLYKKPAPPKRYLSLPDKAASINTFLVILFLYLVLKINSTSHWFYLGVALQNFLDFACVGVGLLGVFFLSFRWGAGDLQKRKYIFLTLFISLYISSIISIYLIEAMTLSIAMIAGYFLGSRRIPLILIVLLSFPNFYLQYGKGDMRAIYWNNDDSHSQPTDIHAKYLNNEGSLAIQPWDYPSYLQDWITLSYDEIEYRRKDQMFESHTSALLERSSMIQLLLMVEDQTPSQVPFYLGATYSHIIESMVPRFLNGNKITPLIGGRMLSLRYGLVNDETVDKVSIAWDMMIESYVNFGLLGCIILGFLLGLAFGYIEYCCAGLPILSFRFLYGATVLLFAFKATGMSLNTFIVSLMQTTVGLVVVAFFLMRYHKFRSMVSIRTRVPTWINVQNQGVKK